MVWGGRGALAALVLAGAMAANADDARAAGAAYQVDTAEVSSPGSCKVESWLSAAHNRDFIAAMSPACVAGLFRPIELSAQYVRARSDGEWATAVTPKVKTNLVPTAIGSWGFAISATATYDFTENDTTAFAVTVPATLRVSNVVRLNVNAGWLVDRPTDRHYFTYGVGVDWRTPDNVWTLTGEVFGQTGPREPDEKTLVEPRFQVGLRYRPVDRFNIDLIYGRNLTGENANWLTLATVYRFSVAEEKK